jgi:hypothetical protein
VTRVQLSPGLDDRDYIIWLQVGQGQVMCWVKGNHIAQASDGLDLEQLGGIGAAAGPKIRGLFFVLDCAVVVDKDISSFVIGI